MMSIVLNSRLPLSRKYLLYETSYVSKEGYFLPHYRVLNLENGEFSEEMNLKDSQGRMMSIVHC